MEEKEIELKDYLQVIWRYKMFIIAITVSAGLFAGIVSLLLPPTYETTFLFKIGKVWEEPIDNEYLLSEFIESENFIAEMNRILNGKNISEKNISAKVKFKEKSSPILVIRVRSHISSTTAEIADKVREALLERHRIIFNQMIKEYLKMEEELKQRISEIEKGRKKIPTNNTLLSLLLEKENIAIYLEFDKQLREVHIKNSSPLSSTMSEIINPSVGVVVRIQPRILLNICLAMFLGFVISLSTAFLLEYLRTSW
ncbi:MAG: Wzz/FepE/Etk N-terminal domain-containing protein [Candidatus Edwardsbacteria bacterium]